MGTKDTCFGGFIVIFKVVTRSAIESKSLSKLSRVRSRGTPRMRRVRYRSDISFGFLCVCDILLRKQYRMIHVAKRTVVIIVANEAGEAHPAIVGMCKDATMMLITRVETVENSWDGFLRIDLRESR